MSYKNQRNNLFSRDDDLRVLCVPVPPRLRQLHSYSTSAWNISTMHGPMPTMFSKQHLIKLGPECDEDVSRLMRREKQEIVIRLLRDA